jgi:hypothetical protein
MLLFSFGFVFGIDLVFCELPSLLLVMSVVLEFCSEGCWPFGLFVSFLTVGHLIKGSKLSKKKKKFYP